jgi:uncharacterized protein
VKRVVPLLAVLLTVVPFAPPAAAATRPDAVWSEAYIPSGDGITTLHADVLRPANLPANAKTPVVLTVSPYTNHTGQTTDFNPLATGHSDRFYDFLDLTRILERGYTYVMVDLPGFGGSGGCNDWGGVREQGAVKAAVEWAAAQPWSTGRVALMGKSYDAWTGLMGIAQQPQGLAAVVAMEPVYAGYNYLYNNGVRFLNSVATPALFSAIDAKPGSLNDTPQYHVSGAPQAWCYGVNIGLQQQDEPNAPFWLERNLLPPSVGEETPLFLTQGFLEGNTKPDAAFDYWNLLDGPNRAWFGQFDHVRGWERAGNGRIQTGREAFVEEMMRFLDHYVKGVPLKNAPVHRDPAVEVQDNLGRYRPEAAWPPPDMRRFWSTLNTGTYADDAQNRGTGNSGGRGVWSFSEPLPHAAWLSGEPTLKVEVNAVVPRANLVGNVYDVAPDGRATLVSRGAYLLRGTGVQRATFDLYGQDWLLRPGHRLGILVSGANAEFWTHIPTLQTVTVRSAEIGLPFLTFDRTRFLEGGSTPRLESHLASAFVPVSAATIAAGQRPFTLPPALKPAK